ncbi:MAG: NAD-dependent epimerase/dehydratase family protein [Chloroflexota bacterium]
MMKLLILGGTVFLGRALVEAALARGHEVTLFNRGQHNPDWFPQVEKMRGNRDGDLTALAGYHWNAVIDTCGYVPRLVRASAELLADQVGHYTFISSLSVYADSSRPNQDESAPVGRLDDEMVEQITGESYGPLKALCEQAAEAAMPGRTLIIRPGLIVGPYDPTDRFTYWPYRVTQGGEVLAPGQPQYVVQVIDVRDLADWTLGLVEARTTGIYNATGPAAPLTLGDVLTTSRQVSRSEATFTWVNEQFLLEAGVQPWSEMPLWVPGEEAAGFHRFNCQKAIGTGLTFRPLVDTIRDTLGWAAGRPADHPWRAGISRQREEELLRAWQGRK